jgi:hypothetical protein
MKKHLHPEHMADLKRSGLTDETIQAAGIYTVPPDEIGKKLGGLANGVVSALAFPYPGCDGFERFKIWWDPIKTGPKPKYLAKSGTPNHLYLLPGVDLEGDSHLIIEEGEKKTLKLAQEGFQAVGISGVWNWLTKGDDDGSHPLPDFDLVNWNRPVTVLFDSDGVHNPDVRLAAWRLAREVAQRGGQVSILFLPAGPNGEKVGADDYLVAHGPEALTDLLKTAWPFDPALNDHESDISWHFKDITPDSPTSTKLKCLGRLVPTLARMSNIEGAAILEELKLKMRLRAADIAGVKADIKAVRKALGKSKQTPAPLALSELEEVKRCHPAIDFLGGGPSPRNMTIGFRVPTPDGKEGLLLIVSDGSGVSVEVNDESLKLDDTNYQIIGGCPPLLEDVWNLRAVKSFIEKPNLPRSLYRDVVTAFKTYLDLQEPAAYGLMAAWTVATYFSQIFVAVSFLNFFGPKESGKTKALEALRFVCFNAYKGRDITAAALGDTVDGMRGTILIDQAERLGIVGKAGEGTINLLGLLADSYKKAGGRRRVVEMGAGGRRVLEFSTFGFKGFASTKPLDPDLADRCIPISMTRTVQCLPDLEGHEPVWANLRDKLYRFALGNFKKVAAAYQTQAGNGTRITELWRPLAAVLTALKVEEAEFEAIRRFFMAKAEETRYIPDGWELNLLEALETRALTSPESFEMAVGDIIEAMEVDSKEKPGAKWVGEILSKFNIFDRKGRVRRDGKKVTAYTFRRARVLQIVEIFLQGPPQNGLSGLSHGISCNESDGLHGTGPRPGTCPSLSTLPPDEGDGPGHVPIGGCVPSELSENTEHLGEWTEGADLPGGTAQKNFHVFDEVEI